MNVGKLSDLKLHLQNVIKNINELEAVEKGTKNLSTAQIKEKTTQLEELLQKVEAAPIVKLKKIAKSRQEKRKLKKIRKKQKIKENPNLTECSKNVTNIQQPVKCLNVPSPTATTSKSHTKSLIKPHIQLRKCHEAQRFLRTFELLKMLHYARGQDAEETRKFAAQFQHLDALWSNILQENKPSRTQERKIEDQWDEVFFGPKEHTYYAKLELKMHDFLRIRRTWDSYLTYNKNRGSSIPIGWVLPPEVADERWAKYKKNETN